MPKREQILVGLDIGTTKICAIVAEITETGALNIIGVGSSPSRGLRKGVVVNIESTVESIKKAVDDAELMAGVEIHSVYTGIAGGHIAGENCKGVVVLKKQEVTREDVQRAVDSARTMAVIPQERRVLHVLPREFMVDDQDGIRDPVGLLGTRLEVNVHIITGAVTSAQNLIKGVNRAGLDVVDIVLQPLASSEAVLSPEEKELGVAMVDFGGGTTDLAIFLDGSVRHTAVLPLGGQNLTKDLAIGLLTSQSEAEKIKLQYGIARADLLQGHQMVEVPSVGERPARMFTRRDIADILEPRVEEMFELVRREIARAGYEGMLGAGVVLTGGTSLLEGMLDAAEKLLNLPARRGVPGGVGGLRDIVSNPIYSTGVGLLLHARQHAEAQELAGIGSGGPIKGALSRLVGKLTDIFLT
ncbi:cell division protein FtsA [Nitrospira tepida]|uniref:Cell division protein FtsA n=1 Tax=Nitrospira tepida TaxID=2973512 RepID=A0AA86T5A1_9BACT|nr:cell division protein FtsA [Nitrospira tepida]CAI4030607.1 cell division protein FtsA [Nitrospira tepida]